MDSEIKREQGMLETIEQQIGQLMQRINNVPGAEVALGKLDRDYQTKKAAYDSLLVQQQRIDLGAEAANQQQGESIQVIDSAYLPSQAGGP